MIEDWKEQLEEMDKRAGKEIQQGFNKLLFGRTNILELFQVLGKERIMNWMEQFETELEKKAAFEIFERIQYYNSADVMNLCRLNYYQWLVRNNPQINDTVFISLGSAGKSGNMIGYLFRIFNNIPAKCVLNQQEIIAKDFEQVKKAKNIVFLDDFSGSGDQFIDNSFVIELINKSKELLDKPTISFLPLVITLHAKVKIEDKFGIEVISQQIRDKQKYSEAENHVIERYGRGLLKNKDKDCYSGWGECAETIVFFYNVPNNSLPILWASGYSEAFNEKWKPLFRRTTTKGRNDSESIYLLFSLFEQKKMYSEDYMMYIQVIVETFSKLTPKTFSLPELRDFLYIVTCLMHPYNYGLNYYTPFMFLSELRNKTMEIVKVKFAKEKISEQDIIYFFTADEAVVEQGTLVINKYSEIIKEYIIRNKKTAISFLNLIDKAYEKTSELALEVYGVFCTILRLMKSRELFPEEISEIVRLRTMAKNEVVKYYAEVVLATIDGREMDYSGINLDQCYVLVNNYGKYEIISVKNKMQ